MGQEAQERRRGRDRPGASGPISSHSLGCAQLWSLPTRTGWWPCVLRLKGPGGCHVLPQPPGSRQDQLQNLQGPVQGENVGLLVIKHFEMVTGEYEAKHGVRGCVTVPAWAPVWEAGPGRG